jgi:mannose-6-phosphate isomerase-like protein (cupin superfamily)
VAYDNPGVATDGMRTSDQLDMYNGAPDRYDWKLLGRREMYVPYNSYRLQDPNVKMQDILTPQHINQDHARYELHRVWVVEATLKKGAKHLYPRRTFYLDEDSWQILVADIYDKRDQLWRVSEGHAMTYYNVPSVWTSLEVHTDLQAGRYLAVGLNSEFPAYNFGIERASQYFTPAALRRAGSR